MTSAHPVTKSATRFAKLGRSFCSLALLLASYPSLSFSATLPEKNFWITDGTVNSLINNANMLYIGGDFNYVGPNTGLATTLNASDASQPQAFPYIDRYIDGVDEAEIYTAVSDGQGGWFVGGTFTTVNNKDDHPYLIHIMSNNQLDNFFNFKPNAPVRALKLSNDGKTLYVGGEFTNISSTPRYRLAAISLSGSYALSNWNPSVDDSDGVINTIDINEDDSVVYIGGKFTSLNGSTFHQGIGALTTEGGIPPSGWSSTPLAVNGIVNTLVITNSGENLAFGGEFSQVTQVTHFNRSNLATVSAEAGNLAAWKPSANGAVLTLAIDQDDEFIYIGGHFTAIGSDVQAYLARIDIAGDTIDADWRPYLNGPVRSLLHTHTATSDATADTPEKIYLGGDFTTLRNDINNAVTANFERFRTARIDVTTSSVVIESWSAHADNSVNTLASAPNGTSIFAGGTFSSIGGIRQANLAALDTTNGSVARNWLPEINGPVNVMSVNKDASYLYLAGDFSLVESKPRKQVARFSLFDYQLDAWAPQIDNGTVSAMALAKIGFAITQIAVEPQNSNRLYAATEKGLYISEDAGASWSKNIALPGIIVRKILIDPNAPDIVYAITDIDAQIKDDERIYRSNDSGETWTAIDSTLTTKDASDIVITSDSTRLYLVTKLEVITTAAGQIDTKGGLLISEDRGDTWDELVAEKIITLAIDPLNDNRLYLSIEGSANAGFFILERALSKKKGEENVYIHNYVDCNTETTNPDPCNIGFDVGRHITKIVPNLARTTAESGKVNTIYAISNGLIYKTEDSAANWSFVRGLPVGSLITNFVADPASLSTLFATVDKQGVFKTINGGFTWSRANNGLSSPLLISLTMDPNDPKTLYTTTSLGIVQKTSDGGGQWLERHEGIPNDILYLGGDFFGTHPAFLAALDTTSQTSNLFLDWNSRSDGKIASMLLSPDNSTLYVGGNFNHIGGTARAKLAELNVPDATATGWNPSVSGNSVNALELSANGKLLYAGGKFAQVNGAPRQNIAAISTATGTPNDWQPDSDGPIHVLKLINSDLLLLAGGNFNHIGEAPRDYFASLFTSTLGTPSSDNNYLTNWQPSPTSAITGQQAVAVNDQIIFIGGDFKRISDTTRQSLAGYVFNRPTINVEPVGGSFNSALIVSFSCKHAENKTCNSADILYTTDKDLANATWKRYNDVPFEQSESATLSYVAIDSEGVSSAISSSKYIIDTSKPSVDIVLPSGKYTYTHTSPLICYDGVEDAPNVSGCKNIFYTLDGSAPTFTTSITISNNQVSRSYSRSGSTIQYDSVTPVPIRIDSTLRVIAVDAAGNTSREIVGYYEVERGEGSGTMGIVTLITLLTVCLGHMIQPRMPRIAHHQKRRI